MERKQITLEYVFRASPAVLYAFFTNPDRLILWFCDEVDINDDIYEFTWEGYPEEATLVDDIEEERVRFIWDEFPDEYLEFDISRSPVTGDTILLIRDFCDADEEEDTILLWNNQITALKRVTGEA